MQPSQLALLLELLLLPPPRYRRVFQREALKNARLVPRPKRMLRRLRTDPSLVARNSLNNSVLRRRPSLLKSLRLPLLLRRLLLHQRLSLLLLLSQLVSYRPSTIYHKC